MKVRVVVMTVLMVGLSLAQLSAEGFWARPESNPAARWKVS